MFILLFRLYIVTQLFGNSEIATASFKKIEFISFDVNSHRTSVKDSIYIGLYASISNKGLISIRNNQSNKEDIYYSVQLDQSEQKSLDTTFTLRKKLNTHLVKTRLRANEGYAGSYDFFRITYQNGSVDSICIIATFMSEELLNIYTFLNKKFYSRDKRKIIKPFQVPIKSINSLKACYRKSTYLPEITGPIRQILQ